ncbi:MAG: hypothetical protein V7711_18030 [Pseudomonadales bacterium]
MSLLLLRCSTGIYLILWGILKFNADKAARVSDHFYGGTISDATLSMGIGGVQVLLGLLVVLGIFRTYAYWGQAIWYAIGIVPIIDFLLDPLALFLVEAPGRLTFFPSWTLFFASLVLIAFKADDRLSVDQKRGKE